MRLRMSGDWFVRRGMLLTGCVICLSVLIALLLPSSLLPYALITSIVLFLSFLLVRRFRHPVVLFCLALCCLAVLRTHVYVQTEVPPAQTLDGTTDTIVAHVVEVPASGCMYTASIVDSAYLAEGTRVLLFCDDRVAPYRGEYVSATVEYRDLFETQLYRRADGVYLQAFPTTYGDDSVIVLDEPPVMSFVQWLRPVRNYFADTIQSLLTGDEGDLLVALCLGDKSSLSSAVSDAFRGCGLPHLLAVSGLHMTVLAGAMSSTLRRMRLRRTVVGVVTIGLIVLYMWLIEFTPSVTRSGLMYILVLLGMLFRRQTDSLNSMGLALTVLLIIAPNTVYDMGFWLSFGATGGILCYYARVRGRLQRSLSRLPRHARRLCGVAVDGMALTLTATLPLLPLTATSFREIALVSPLANILTVLPAGWMLILGFVGILLRASGIFAALGELILLLAGLIGKYLIHVAEELSALPGATVLLQHDWQIVWVVGACVLLAVALLRFRAILVRRIWCACLALLLVAVTASASFTEDYTTVKVINSEGYAVLVLEHNGKGAALVQELSGIYSARRTLEDDGYRTSTLLVADNGSTSEMALLAEWQYAYPDTRVYSAGRVARFSTVPQVAAGETIHFWDEHSLQLLDDGWWLLSIGNSRMLVAPRKRVSVPQQEADAYVLLESALPKTTYIRDASVVIIRADQPVNYMALGKVETVEDEECLTLITDGTRQWYVNDYT